MLRCGTSGSRVAEPARLATPFAYTVGLFGIGHPELLDRRRRPAHGRRPCLNDVSARVRAGHDLVARRTRSTFEGWTHRVTVEAVPNPGEIVFAANRFYQRPDEYSVPLYQLTYDDRARPVPVGRRLREPAWMQPRPGELARLSSRGLTCRS